MQEKTWIKAKEKNEIWKKIVKAVDVVIAVETLGQID